MLRVLVKQGVEAEYIPRLLVRMRVGGGEQRDGGEPVAGESDGSGGVAGERVAAVSVDAAV
jgi:hypothetical protein